MHDARIPNGAIASRDRGLGSPIRLGTHPTEILVQVEEYVRPGKNVATSSSHVINPDESQEHLRLLETAGTRHHAIQRSRPIAEGAE
jgi:hypothetical protein